MQYPTGAFCEILFAANGGQFDQLNRPVFQKGIKAACDVASECGLCPHMERWLAQIAPQGYRASWECISCISEESESPIRKVPGRILKAFFQEGHCAKCDEHFNILQLVLRNP